MDYIKLGIFLILFWTFISSTVLVDFLSKKSALCVTLFGCLATGLFFIGNAYHFRYAFLNPFEGDAWQIIGVGIVWSLYLAFPNLLAVKLLKKSESIFLRSVYSVLAAVVQLVVCIIPSIPLLGVFSME